ncbi:MAG: hypothetical protein CK424_07125 [Legionella sp.]|nr:MAG: hypothetical protein CK424_07125 [Legionella sp.]
MYTKKEPITKSEQDVVVSKPAGAKRENSLYHYIANFQEDVYQRDFSVSPSGNEQRHAWYITAPVVTDPKLFPDFVLKKEHLSIDRDFNIHVDVLSPHHYTAIYQHASTSTCSRVIHVYFDSCGGYRSAHVTEYSGDNSLGTSVLNEKTVYTITSQKQFKAYKQLLTDLLDLKTQIYLKANEDAPILNDKLTSLLQQTASTENFEIIKDTLQRYKQALCLVSLLDEAIVQDGRKCFLDMFERGIKQYEQRLLGVKGAPSLPSLEAVAVPDSENAFTLRPIVKTGKSVLNTVSEDGRALTALQDQVNTFVTNFQSDPNLFVKSVTYVEVLTVQKNLIELYIGSTTSSFTSQLKKLDSQLTKLLEDMVGCFNVLVLSGDIGVMSKLFGIEPYIDLKPTYWSLLEKIEQLAVDIRTFKEIEIQRKKYIAIANDLYANSSVYRSVFYLFQQVESEMLLSCPSVTIHASLGVLAVAIMRCDLEVVQMYLEQDVSPNSVQFSIIGHAGFYNILYFLVISQRYNYLPSFFDDRKMTDLISLLFKHGATLRHQKLLRHAVPIDIKKYSRELMLSDKTLALAEAPGLYDFNADYVLLATQEDDAMENILDIVSTDYRLAANPLMKPLFDYCDDKYLRPEDSNIATLTSYYLALVLGVHQEHGGSMKFQHEVFFYRYALSCYVFADEIEKKKAVFDEKNARYTYVFTGAEKSICSVKEVEKLRAILQEINSMSLSMGDGGLRSIRKFIDKSIRFSWESKNEEQEYLSSFAGYLSTLAILLPTFDDYEVLFKYQYLMLKSMQKRNVPIRNVGAYILKDSLPEEVQRQLEKGQKYQACLKLFPAPPSNRSSGLFKSSRPAPPTDRIFSTGSVLFVEGSSSSKKSSLKPKSNAKSFVTKMPGLG